MVTFSYFLIIGLMGGLTIALDMLVFHQSFMKCVMNIYKAEVGAGAITIVFTACIGLIWSIIVDIRLRNTKSESAPAHQENKMD